MISVLNCYSHSLVIRYIISDQKTYGISMSSKSGQHYIIPILFMMILNLLIINIFYYRTKVLT